MSDPERTSFLRESSLMEYMGSGPGAGDLGSVADHAPDSIARMDRELRYRYVNPALATWLGREPDELLGRTNRELGLMDPLQEAWESRLLQVFRTGEGLEFEFMAAGRWFHALIHPEPGRPVQTVLCVTRDVSARKEIELALARLAAIVESSHDAIFSVTLDLEINTWNAGAQTLYGYSAEEVLGRPVTMLAPESKQQEVRWLQERMQAGERVTNWRTQRRRKDGSLVEVSLTVSPMLDAAGNAVGASAIARDITETRRMEENLRDRVRQMECLSAISSALRDESDPEVAVRSVVAMLPTGFRNPDGVAFRVRRRSERRAGAHDPPLLLRLPLDVPDAEPWELDLLQLSGGASLLDEERQMVRTVAERLSGTLRRIAAEREKERTDSRFRSLTEGAPDLITILDAEGKVVYQSPAVRRILGYDPEQGGEAFDTIHPEDLPEALRTFAESRARPGEPLRLEFRCRHRDGSWRLLEVWVRNLLHDPAVGGVVCNSRDITERRELESRLQQSQKMEAIGCLAGGVAHDFNNLLTVIAGNAEILLQSPLAEAVERREIEEILAAALRGAGLTRQLLTFSRQGIVQPRPVDPNVVVADLGRMLERLIGEDVELVTCLTPLHGCVVADRGQLEQVILNLAVNARAAMPEGGRLTLTTLREGPHVVLRVEDTGVGMPPDVQEHIFEPFFTTRTQGTGLGLATVYGIVHGAGGSIEVQSRVGQGTSFLIRLPWVAPEAATDVEPSEAAALDSPAGETILVVEDDGVVRRLSTRILERAGYRVLTADSGPAALEVVRQHDGPLDLLMTDVVMPRMNGWELAMQLSAARPALGILFISGYTADTVLDQGMLERDEIHFLEKPYGPDALLRVVRRILTGRAGPR